MGDYPKDMVIFELPDGTQVSNDRRFDLDEALTKSLNSRESKGDIGITWDEQQAQIMAEKLDALNSGQPGVGPNAVPDDVVRNLHGPLGSPAQQKQVEDMEKAKEAGANPNSTSVDDDEPVDSNERVLEVRKARKEAQKKAAKAADQLGDDGPGDPEKPYSEWSAKQLKAEILSRNAEEDRAEEDQLELPKQKSAAAELLDQDDARKAGGASGSE